MKWIRKKNCASKKLEKNSMIKLPENTSNNLETLLKEMVEFHNELFLLEAKAPIKTLEDEVENIRIKVAAIIDALKDIIESGKCSE